MLMQKIIPLVKKDITVSRSGPAVGARKVVRSMSTGQQNNVHVESTAYFSHAYWW